MGIKDGCEFWVDIHVKSLDPGYQDDEILMKYMTSVIDAHIHLFPEAIANDPLGWAEEHGEIIWRRCVMPPDRPSLQGWPTVDQTIRDMDDARIERVILQGWYWEKQESCKIQNRFYAELIHRYPDRFSGFLSLHPPSGQSALEEIEWARDHGFCGVGEIHPQAQNFSLMDECWRAVMEKIVAWKAPVTLHVTDPHTPDYPGKVATPLDDYLTLAKTWPDQVFILAHLGGGIPLLRAESFTDGDFPNLYFDCAAIPLLYERAIVPQISNITGAEKILFGTDYPLKTFPKRQRDPDFARSVDHLKKSGLSRDEKALVLSGNVRRLMDW